MGDNIILLVEDNAEDEALTLRALKKNNIRNEVVIVGDGAEGWIIYSAPAPMRTRIEHDRMLKLTVTVPVWAFARFTFLPREIIVPLMPSFAFTMFNEIILGIRFATGVGRLCFPSTFNAVDLSRAIHNSSPLDRSRHFAFMQP